MRWTVRDDAGSETEIDVDSLAEAKEKAEEWVRDGEWGDEGAVVHVDATAEDFESFVLDVVIEPDEDAIDPNSRTHCFDEHTHLWERPYSVVGGCKENPGVWSIEGGVFAFLDVCRCGAHRHSYSKPGAGLGLRIEYPFGLWPDSHTEDCPNWFSGRNDYVARGRR